MPSVSYYNRTGPFWDFVANLEEQGASHPFFGNGANRGETSDNEAERPNPWAAPWAGFPWGPMPHRGRPNRNGPPPPPGAPGAEDQEMPEAGPSDRDTTQAPPPAGEKSDEEDPFHPHHGRHGHHGHHGRHSHRGPFRHAGRGGCSGRGRGRGGGPGGFHPYGAFGSFADLLQEQFFGGNAAASGDAAGQDFRPEADVFDTASAFVVHVALPGAKKEDVGVSWDAEKSELRVAGVVYRPGDEEFLKALALGERRVGAFERTIRLGSRANPAQIDAEAITAKMEDGVLTVEVPKLESGFVEVKKVDIE